MPSVNYYNQTAPFWDWVASMEEQGQNHPWFANRGEQNNENANEDWQNMWTQRGPWGQGVPAMPHGNPFMGRGQWGAGPPDHRHRGASQPPQTARQTMEGDEKADEAGPSNATGEAAPAAEQTGEGSRPRGERPQRCGRPGRGGSREGWESRGGWGSRGRGGLFGGGHGHGGLFGRGQGFPMGAFGAAQDLGNMFQDQLFGQTPKGEQDDDFKPEVDVFDTTEAFVVHVSLPGAKKEDVGVNWDAEKSELSIAGVVYRPGDEEFLQTLAMNERKIGAFERKVRLGSRANPAAVDVEGIHARMEDGVLTVEVPKLDSGYVEVKKVDIE